ncbi:MAG: hypothetical protein A2802_00425 [Candidatus Woykebacteria bacterium RIFCSPHIGHO2_01_FULL_43_29]|nr:MAG: hypothetical protein A2802_00425 [Candidatus Woykebacteria bacterium RIFCSPHIGHO2_01_FULL_43_29]
MSTSANALRDLRPLGQRFPYITEVDGRIWHLPFHDSRTFRAIQEHGGDIFLIKHLADFTEADLLKIPGIGEKLLADILQALEHIACLLVELSEHEARVLGIALIRTQRSTEILGYLNDRFPGEYNKQKLGKLLSQLEKYGFVYLWNPEYSVWATSRKGATAYLLHQAKAAQPT